MSVYVKHDRLSLLQERPVFVRSIESGPPCSPHLLPARCLACSRKAGPRLCVCGAVCMRQDAADELLEFHARRARGEFVRAGTTLSNLSEAATDRLIHRSLAIPEERSH